LFDTGLYVLLVDASRFEPIEIAISGDEDITVGRDVLEPISISPVSRVVAPTVRREDIVPQGRSRASAKAGCLLADRPSGNP
jgi:hypothetical protein